MLGQTELGKRLRMPAEAAFYAALVLELVMVVIDKSAYTNPYEGWLFRITFLLFGFKLLLSDYSVKEWIWILAFGIIGVLCWQMSTRDEAVRLVVFCAAFCGEDVKKTLKTAFYVTGLGCLVLIVLSLTGIYGYNYIIDEGDRGIRYCFGLGHPNAFFCMCWILMTLALVLYHEKIRLWHYVVLFVLGIALYLPTNSRSGIILWIFTLAMAQVLQFSRAGQTKWIYICGIAGFVLCVVISVTIACYPPYEGPFAMYLDRFITGRIGSMNTLSDGGGRIINWRLFSRPENYKYFDLGYVRIFYWYGVIPALCYLGMWLALMIRCFKRRDAWAFLMLTAFALYTFLEAHLVSVYLGRNYALFLLGAWWTDCLPGLSCRGKEERL